MNQFPNANILITGIRFVAYSIYERVLITLSLTFHNRVSENFLNVTHLRQLFVTGNKIFSSTMYRKKDNFNGTKKLELS